uniref:ZDB-PUB-030905-1 n=1 Tax=Nothobranchius korthausae TaxID=1143690 RepID=A0A1A8H5B7_9TELE
MAPVLSGDWWSGTADTNGGVLWLGSEQLVSVVSLGVLTGLLLASMLLLLCASCKGEKKAANGHPGGDQLNLMNGVSERETISQSADSPVTDAALSCSYNGPLTSGTILSDTQDTSPQLSLERLSSHSELRSSKCHQDRELPSIPPSTALTGDRPPATEDSTYEMVKDIAAASRDVSVEDSLYETVKELKEGPAQPYLSNGTAQSSPGRPPASPQPPVLQNGKLSPVPSKRVPLSAGAEYASVNLSKKSRHSVDMEAKRRSNSVPPRRPQEDPQEDAPPPVPEKVLDENDNQPVVTNGLSGVHNGELHSPLSAAPDLDNHFWSNIESEVYSSVKKTNCNNAANDEDKEHDYSSIAELKGLVPTSSSSDLYATVRDIYSHPDEPLPGEDTSDPCYESIRIPKTSSSDDDQRVEAEGTDAAKGEPDYESVGELGLRQDISRL